MKVKIEIDCTPQEARAMLGLPDIGAVQEEVMEQVKRRVGDAVADLDAQQVLKAWTGASAEGMERVMGFWSGLAGREGKDKT